MGCLRFRKNKVKMQFSADFVCSLDSTGRLLQSLLSRSSMTGSAVSGRKDALSQTASGDVVVFPKIGLYVAPGRAAGEGALQTPKGQAEKKKKGEARREEEAKRTGTVRAVAPARPLYPPLLRLLLRARGSEPRPKGCTLCRRRPSCDSDSCDSSSAGPW
ncbi:uncharacterized protein ACIBXB_003603 [Morphnus guianensis]